MEPWLPVYKRVRGKPMRPGSIYVGRGSRWGNPYRIESDVIGGSLTQANPRLVAIGLFTLHLAKHPELLDQLAERLGQVIRAGLTPSLTCWCRDDDAPAGDGDPVRCHADVYVEALMQRGRGSDL